MSCTLKGIKINEDKDSIIDRYNYGVGIHALADDYDIKIDTMCRRLKMWGVKIKRGDYKRRREVPKPFKMKKSSELLSQIAVNTMINNLKIKYY